LRALEAAFGDHPNAGDVKGGESDVVNCCETCSQDRSGSRLTGGRIGLKLRSADCFQGWPAYQPLWRPHPDSNRRKGLGVSQLQHVQNQELVLA
jgi:hypothetical protein